MTETLYENNSYIKEFQAVVLSCTAAPPETSVTSTAAPPEASDTSTAAPPDTSVISTAALPEADGGNIFFIVLDKTAFFPEGGGQNPDTGWLDGQAVVDVQIYKRCCVP